MSPIIPMIVAVIAVGILILIAISLNNKRGFAFNQEEYQANWLKIEHSLIKENPASYNLAIIKADRLLGHALNEMGVPGKTMADHLKRAESKFTKINSVWSAHKLRNQIAHEHGFEASYEQAQRALAAFRQGLKDLGAI